MIKFELRRAFDSRSFKIAIFIGLIISFAQVIFHTMPYYADPLKGLGANTYPRHLFISFMGADRIIFYSTFVKLLPLLCTMAYGISFSLDYSSGYLKNIITLKKREDYLRAKYISVFVVGGFIAIIPMVVNILFTACLVPTMGPFLGHGGIRNGLFYSHPFLYVALMLLKMFLYAGTFSTIALAGTFLVRNRFLLSVLPFAIWYILNVSSRYTISTIGTIAPEALISLELQNKIPWLVWVEWLLIALVTYLIFVKKGRKLDVL